MSAGVSIIGQCEECCVCPEATVEWDSVSASLTKSGFEEFGTPSSPAKIYLSTTADGTMGNAPASTWVNAKTTYDPITTALTYTGSITDSASVSCSYSGSDAYFAPIFIDTDSCAGTVRDRYSQDVLQNCPNDIDSAWGSAYVKSITSTTVKVWGTCDNSNELTETLGDEYTTALLKSNTVAALPAYDNDWNDTAGSYANLTTDELTYSARESRYRLRFKTPIIGFGDCYKVTWIERFTPEGGGAVTDTARCDIWDGTPPSGYDPEDSSTWPVLPSDLPYYYELPVPSSDGTTTVVDVVAECVDCSACP